MQAEHPRVILASGSSARRALLEGVGLRFAVQPAKLDEAAVKQQARDAGESAEQAALRLALAKAAAVGAQAPDALVIGADQILVCRAEWYDKPSSLPAARTQLLNLRGRTHGLATAVACVRDGRPVWQHVETPRLAMRAFSAEFLDAYLEREDERVLGSVGAYRLEGPGVLLFERMQGDHSAILGLPLLPLLRFLRDSGLLLA